MHRKLILTLIGVASMFLLTACPAEAEPDAQANESASQQSSYETVVKNQPAGTMEYSPSRETINGWIETWDAPDKLSYVYFQNADGKVTGYFVFKGLPVNYCASLTPTYRVREDQYGNLILPAPSVDGVYYSGGQCGTYYGFDATSDTYLEYTVGQGINVLVREEPLPVEGVLPLGDTTIPENS